MNFVDEENVVFFQIGQQRSQVLGFFQHRATGLAQIDPQFMRNDVAQRGLPQPGRTKQQDMV